LVLTGFGREPLIYLPIWWPCNHHLSIPSAVARYRHCTICQCSSIVPSLWPWLNLLVNDNWTTLSNNNHQSTSKEGKKESAYQVWSCAKSALSQVASRLGISAGNLAPGLQSVSRSIFECLATEKQRATRIGTTWARRTVLLADRRGVPSHDSHQSVQSQTQRSSCLGHQGRRDWS
jgi:hypothetical protein